MCRRDTLDNANVFLQQAMESHVVARRMAPVSVHVEGAYTPMFSHKSDVTDVFRGEILKDYAQKVHRCVTHDA